MVYCLPKNPLCSGKITCTPTKYLLYSLLFVLQKTFRQSRLHLKNHTKEICLPRVTSKRLVTIVCPSRSFIVSAKLDCHRWRSGKNSLTYQLMSYLLVVYPHIKSNKKSYTLSLSETNFPQRGTCKW